MSTKFEAYRPGQGRWSTFFVQEPGRTDSFVNYLNPECPREYSFCSSEEFTDIKTSDPDGNPVEIRLEFGDNPEPLLVRGEVNGVVGLIRLTTI